MRPLFAKELNVETKLKRYFQRCLMNESGVNTPTLKKKNKEL